MDYKKFIREGKRKADITPLLENAEAFGSVIKELFKLFGGMRIDKVAGVEANGFIFAAPIADKLNAGFVPIRKPGELQNEIYSEGFVDYSGKQKTLEIHKDAVRRSEKVLLIDDWLETGNTMRTAIKLVEECGGEVIGVGVFMDDSTSDTKKDLEKYNYKFVEKDS